MKIYIIINNIYRFGGTERAVANLSDLLSSHYDVTIVSLTSKGNETSCYPINPKVKIKSLKLLDLQSSLISKLKWFLIIKRKIKALNIPSGSTVIGTGHNINSVLSLCGFENDGIKTIACEHIQIDSIPFISRCLVKYTYKKINNIVVLSESARQKVKKFLRIENNVHVIPNSLPFQSDNVSSLNNPQIIMVGRLSPEKGYERVVKIATFLKLHYPLWRISIFGSGNLRSSLESLFQNKGLDNVTIFNPVTDIQEKYLESSIYIMTSYNEAMPMVILEANSCGLPVVAFECEGTQELIKDGVNGYIVRNNDYVLFNEKLSLLIESIDLRKKIGQAAHRLSIQYSKENISELWDNLLL